MLHHVAGFTLVELLVVIVIIAILCGLLFPVLKNSREVAQSVKCISNLRHLGIAETLYRQDHEGIILGYNQSGSWSEALWNGGYLPSNKFESLLCPSQPPSVANITKYPGPQYHIYGIRHWNIPTTPASIGINDAVAGTYAIRSLCVVSPSNFMLFADTVCITSGSSSYGLQHWVFQFNKAAEGAIHLRHNGRANIYFLDGHCEAADQARIREAGIKEMSPATVIFVAKKNGETVQIKP